MPALDLNSTFGALLIGVFFSALLLGVTLTQVFYYFQNYYSDSFVIKTSVVALLIMETMKSAFGAHAIYHYVILNYMNPAALNHVQWSAIMTQGISTPIILVVHIFYIRRVHYMSRKNMKLVVPLIVLSFASFAISLGLTAQFFQKDSFEAEPVFINLASTSLAASVAVDVITAASLSFYLHTSKSGVLGTDTLINKLMAYTINNVILTSVFDIIVLVFLTANPRSDYFFAVATFQVVGNLYTNSLMATLNSRKSLKQRNPISTLRVVGGNNMHVSAETEGMRSDEDNKHELLTITITEDVHVA